jgi:hypothetical protein
MAKSFTELQEDFIANKKERLKLEAEYIENMKVLLVKEAILRHDFEELQKAMNCPDCWLLKIDQEN